MVTRDNPMNAFIKWFEALPVPHRKFLAHMYRVCTTDNTIDLVMDPADSLERFKSAFVKPDFPLRVTARLFSVRAVFDLILVNRDIMIAMAEELLSATDAKNVKNLSHRQWEQAFESWRNLRMEEMSDMHVHAWAKQMLKQ